MPLDSALTRAATTRPNSYDPETRRVSAVIATPSPVTRRDARGPFQEVLTADTLDLSIAGLPVLDSHNTASVRHQIGRVRDNVATEASENLIGGAYAAKTLLRHVDEAITVRHYDHAQGLEAMASLEDFIEGRRTIRAELIL